MGPREAESFMKRELPYTYLPLQDQDAIIMDLLCKGILPDRLCDDGTFPALLAVVRRQTITWWVIPFIIHGVLMSLSENHQSEARLWHQALLFLDTTLERSGYVDSFKFRYMIRSLLVSEGYIRVDKLTRDEKSPLPEIPSLGFMFDVAKNLPTLLHTPRRKEDAPSSLSSKIKTEQPK